ncbi:glycosyltransferase involved in cell wall biosynthesis [Mycetocola sp. BIGb0189]|uniref:glycosyltransferase n=1 Tax=Mycetocola sp. BIGb0189 TaxID=2940604 RepID=UPI0021673E23|nr:glycosyltransferase [Mycetocola sp. BIGb0189]MCS4277522.1 glycosyltransferase involved in cell wall biosynthesis [Mycetocola sp. BIGb0189]
MAPSSKSVVVIGTRGYPSYYGGFETAVRRIAPYLADEGWDVTVYGRTGSTRDEDPGRDPRVHTVVTGGIEKKSLSTLTYGLTACWHAARHKPDVALVMNVANGFWLPLLRMRGIKTLVNVDGIEWDRQKWGRLAKLTFRIGAKLTARWGNRMVYDAEAIAERWKRDFGVDGVFIPYGGDEPSETLPVPEGLTRRGYVLVVARFVPENTVGEFFDAVETLGQNYDVVIVGSSGYGGELDERAEDLAARLPRVQWLGHVSDDAKLHALWQHAGVYFHGHSVGGTNPALVQAMACGAPTVARDTVYNREVLGEGAVLTAPEPQAIIQACERMLGDADLQERSAATALERSRAIYTWDRVCGAYEENLAELAG